MFRRNRMVTITQIPPELSSPITKCKEYFTIDSEKHVEGGEHQEIWILATIGNCLFCLAFLTTSYFIDSIDTGFIIFRLLIISAHLITSHVSMIRSCDTRVVLWTSVFVLVNIVKLIQIAYKKRPTR